MKTSIIILTYNQLKYTQECIASIRKYTARNEYEIIVVDNNSTDGTVDWLKQQTDLQLIFNKDNVGFTKGCNQGIAASAGDNILLLNNDVVVTENWLTNLITCLYSRADIGAVGPVTNNCAYYQTIKVDYKSLNEMQKFARQFNKTNPTLWEERLRLIGFCMLIKRAAISEVGLLDERFSPGNYEDDDLSLRLITAGYHLMLCKDTFIHHFGSTSFKQNREEFTKLLALNGRKFEEKWGFNCAYSTYIRHDIVNLLDAPKDDPIRVLEVGCACGATLLKIKDIYQNAELYGIEVNENSARIAGGFTNILVTNIEQTQLEYPDGFFDYIILADVLEHLTDPWHALINLRKHLKPGGSIVASIPNVMHYSVLRNLIGGSWSYQTAGILDRSHLRFFTLAEIEKMFLEAGFTNLKYTANVTGPNEADEQFVGILSDLAGDGSAKNQFLAYQYLVKGNPCFKQEQLLELLVGVVNEADPVAAVAQLKTIDMTEIIKAIEMLEKPVGLLNCLAVKNFEAQAYDNVLPYLNRAFEIDNVNKDTLYNLSYVLTAFGEYDLADSYLEKIAVKDEQVMQLSVTVAKAKQNCRMYGSEVEKVEA